VQAAAEGGRRGEEREKATNAAGEEAARKQVAV